MPTVALVDGFAVRVNIVEDGEGAHVHVVKGGREYRVRLAAGRRESYDNGRPRKGHSGGGSTSRDNRS